MKNQVWSELKLKIAQQGNGVSMNEIIEDIQSIIDSELQTVLGKINGIASIMNNYPTERHIDIEIKKGKTMMKILAGELEEIIDNYGKQKQDL